jgi:hypothetical protein
MIVPLLTNMYGKISTVIVFDAPKISQGRSTGAEPEFEMQKIDLPGRARGLGS